MSIEDLFGVRCNIVILYDKMCFEVLIILDFLCCNLFVLKWYVYRNIVKFVLIFLICLWFNMIECLLGLDEMKIVVCNNDVL